MINLAYQEGLLVKALDYVLAYTDTFGYAKTDFNYNLRNLKTLVVALRSQLPFQIGDTVKLNCQPPLVGAHQNCSHFIKEGAIAKVYDFLVVDGMVVVRVIFNDETVKLSNGSFVKDSVSHYYPYPISFFDLVKDVAI